MSAADIANGVEDVTDAEVEAHMALGCCYEPELAASHIAYERARDADIERTLASETPEQRTDREIREDRLAEYAFDDRERSETFYDDDER